MSDFTNLLPPERIQSLRRDYYLRLAVVASWFVAALAAVAGILLLPSYLFLVNSASEKERTLASLRASLSTLDEAGLSARLTSLNDSAAQLAALADTRSVSTLMQELLIVAHPGIALSGFSYVPGDSGGATIAVTGVADTRSSLRNYQLALEQAPFARAAALPVSAYAKDSDIPFTIQVTLVP